MKMKKFFALLLSLSMVLSLAACGSKGTDHPMTPKPTAKPPATCISAMTSTPAKTTTAPIMTNGATRPTKSFSRKL